MDERGLDIEKTEHRISGGERIRDGRTKNSRGARIEAFGRGQIRESEECPLMSGQLFVGPLILLTQRVNMAKKKPRENKEREERITMEIIVDAYGSEEHAMGWYYYLEEKLQFPFTAVCNAKRAISPLHVQDEVDVIGMAPEEECEKEIFVLIRWERDGLAVPLSQLTPINATETQTKEAVEDWHYWVDMGYEFG